MKGSGCYGVALALLLFTAGCASHCYVSGPYKSVWTVALDTADRNGWSCVRSNETSGVIMAEDGDSGFLSTGYRAKVVVRRVQATDPDLVRVSVSAHEDPNFWANGGIPWTAPAWRDELFKTLCKNLQETEGITMVHPSAKKLVDNEHPK
jgi:hypothetical protein